jgi:A/G-specific adenine glycosylase
MPDRFPELLLDWYQRHARVLPWRGHPDPYAVWVSEIMLQQTRVEAVIPYFERWMKRFPTVERLAEAEQYEVLKLWEGLGYYSRVRNLHRAAQIVARDFNAQMPESADLLCKLPGIGRYTAAAIASIAFGQDVAALDGNIRRVLARLFDVSEPARSAVGEQMLWDLAAAHLPPGRAGDYNQALMDLGAMICTPKAPGCQRCPLGEICLARARGLQEQRPVRRHRPAIPHHTVTAAIIQRDGGVLIARRPEQGLLGGLWEFPGGKLQDGESLVDCLKREIGEELEAEIEVQAPFGVYRHAFTHFKITLHAFQCALRSGEPRPVEASEIRWVTTKELNAFPMGKVDRQIANRLIKER